MGRPVSGPARGWYPSGIRGPEGWPPTMPNSAYRAARSATSSAEQRQLLPRLRGDRPRPRRRHVHRHCSGLEVPDSPLGPRILLLQRRERRTVARLDEVGELVHQDAVHDPGRERGVAVRDADGAIFRRAGRQKRRARRAARTVRSISLASRSRVSRFVISSTHRASSAALIPDGIDTRNTPSTNRAETLRVRRRLRTTSSSIPTASPACRGEPRMRQTGCGRNSLSSVSGTDVGGR